MADNDNRRKLYDNINKEYDLPDYDQFSKDMEDDTKRKKLYDAVAKEYDLPDYNKFSQDMGYGQQQATTNNQQNIQQSTQATPKPQPQQTATVDSRHAEKSYDEQKAAYDKQYAETYNKLAKEGRVRMGIENHPNVKMVAVTDDLIKKFPILEQSRGYQVPFDMNYGTPIMQNLNDKGDIITPDEARKQYTKILTNQDFDYVPQQETAAVQVGNVIKTSISPKGGWLDNITKGSLEYAYGKDWRDKKYEIDGKEVSANDMYARTKQELYDDINTGIGNIRHSLLFATDEQKKETVDQLYEKGYLKEDILPKGTVLHYIMNVGKDEQLEELKQRRTKAQVQKEMVQDRLQQMPERQEGETTDDFYDRSLSEGALYQSDLRKLDKQINQYDAVIDELEGKNTSGREWEHAIKTSGIKTLGAWDFGATDLKDAMAIQPLARKLEKGDNISQADYMGLKILSQANDADAVEGAVMPSSYNIKKGGLVSAPFTLQFMLTGDIAQGVTSAVNKTVARGVKGAIYKAAGKKALGAAERFAEKAASSKVVGFFGMLGKDFEKAFFMENTTGAATTGAEILNRRNGTVTESEDGFEWQGETLPMAIYKGEVSQNIELQTEFLGEHFPSSLKFIRGMAHTKVGSAMGLRNLAAWLSKLSRKDLANTIRSYATKGGINGLWGEYMEEVAGTAENALLVGDQKFSDLFDAKQQWETFGSVALSCIGMGLFGTAVYTGQRGLNMPRYYQMKHLQSKWENTAMDLFSGDEWAQMKEKIDNTPNENAGELLASIVRDQKLTEQQARAAFNYARCMLTLRGMNIGTMKAAQLGLTDDKTIEQDQAYVEGREASDEDKHDVQIEYEDKTKELAGMLGISEQQLANMSDEELESLTGNDDKLDNVIYDYQNSHAKYQGVMDNADDNIDMAAQQAARQADMVTDKSRGTVRNVTIKATKGGEDYGVYIVSGNIATNEDGSINVSESDNMILYYDPQTGKIEHADASRFAAIGEEVNAEEAKNQAIADAKEKAIRKEAGIIDGTVGEGSSFTITDAEGNEHTYEVLADNGDGTAMITLDGNVQDTPVSLEELQKLKDVEDAKKLEAAKLEREQHEKERELQREKDNAPVEDNLDYSEVINNDGKIEIADVMNENGTSMFPDAQEVFFIQNQGNRAKVMVLDNEGNLKAKMVKKSAVVSLGTMSVDEYKEERQQMLKESGKGYETSSVEEDRGEKENLQPIGKGTFGNIYNQFKGKVKEAFNFLISHKSGDLLGVFHRDDVGDIDLVWGNDKMGLAHIIGKHIGKGKDFENIDDAINMIDEVINKGGLIQDTDNRYVISLNGFRVGIRKNFDGTKKNWIVTAIDYNRSKEEKGIATNPTSASHGVEGSELAAPNDSQNKDTLWERGANETSTTATATASVTTNESQLSSEQSGSASHQNNVEKGIATNPTSTSHGTKESESTAALNDSQGKGTSNESNKQENSEKITLEDGTEVPMKEDGNPDFSQLTAKQTAELYDTQFGEDAEQIISDNVKKSKNALDKATNRKVTGSSFAEQKASKDAKDKAIAEAQEKYDSAKAVADAYNERQLAKEEDTPEGRQNLIDKARKKFNRMKGSVKDNAQAVAQLYNDTVGSLLHRLYDGTGIDVFDDTANTVEEYVASHIAPYSLSYDGTETSKGVKQETGLSRTDFAKTGFLAKEGKGKTIDKLAHDLWQERPENLQDITDQDVRNAIIDIITSGETAFGLRNYIQDMRIAQAERVLEGQKQQADELAYAEQRKAEEKSNEQENNMEISLDEKKAKENQSASVTQNEKPVSLGDSNSSTTTGSQEALHGVNSPDLHGKDTSKESNEQEKGEKNTLEDDSNMPFGTPFDDAPFSAKDETEEQSSEERQAFVEKNRVNDIKLVDDVIGKKLRKSLERIAKMMGAKIQWQRTDMKGNGWFNSGTNTIYLTLDSSITEGVQFIFGHEMTHEIKTKSPAMYDELKSLVKNMYGEDMYEGMTDDNEQKYTDAGIAGYDRSYYEEETVADAIGDMMNDLNLAHSLALKMSHPLLAQVHNVLLKVKTAFFGTEYSDAARNAIRTIEQVYVRTANGTFESSESEETNDEQFSVREANERFNNELSRYQNGEMAKNEILHLGNPQGVMRIFLPDLPVVMRQRIIKKGSEKKHDVDVSAIMNMPERLSSPLFVFQRSENTIGVLTDMIDRSGKNVCVAIELKRQIQQGAEYLEVNDVRSFHGREFKNIIEPIVNNKTLMWVDKEKGLSYLSSASQQVQQEIDNKILSSAANIVRNFENPNISEKKVSNDEQFSVRDANERFNSEIEDFKNKSHKGLMHLGAPSPILKACGVDVDEITLSPKVLNRKLNQHSLTSDDVKDLVNSIQKPIMVYRHGEGTPNIVIITNADIRGNKLSLALELDEDGNVTKLNNVSSIHDKDAEKEVKRWFSWDEGYLENALRWVDKEKVSDWLSSARLNSYSQTEYNQKLSSLAKVLNDFKNPNISEENVSNDDEKVLYSLRQKPEPEKKGIGYKVFVLGKDGKLYPPMVANPNGAATPVGVWLDADAAPIAGESKTGRPQVKQGGKGTQGGSGKLAYRPGWHLGVIPYALQFNRKDTEGNKTLFPKNFVFAEVEYAADKDYQDEAHAEGINANGKYQHSLAGLKHLPTDGYYMYRTNPNPETDPWVITGAMKVNRLLTRAEQAELVRKAGREPQKIQDGDTVTDEVVNNINQEIANAPKFSLRVYHGSGADFTEFDFDHMGEGAGDQVFGWGGYVTSSKEIGKSYANLNDAKNLYEVNIPDDNGSNYLDWYAVAKPKLKEKIREYIEKETDPELKALPIYKEAEQRFHDEEGDDKSFDKEMINDAIEEFDRSKTVGDYYEALCMRSAPKFASKFLSSLGYTGFKYPAGTIMGGTKEGDMNYVIFKPEDMQIAEHEKFSLKRDKDDATEFHNIIDKMFEDDFDKSKHLRERYDLGKTPTWMKNVGIKGDGFSLSFKSIKVHKGKDVDHDLTKEEWHELPKAIKEPFAITRYQGANDRFRLYVNINHNGKPVAVGIDVKRVNQGKGKPQLDVNSIKTVFAHHGEIGGTEVLVAYDEKITPQQQALLRGLNFHEYPTIQELSAANIDKSSETSKQSGEKFSLKTDNQGNPLNADGTLKLDKIKSVYELTDDDFLHPSRNIQMPTLPKKVADAIGVGGKPVVIKKNIFERNYIRHKDVTPKQSKAIFNAALYNPDLYGQNQKAKRPYNWVLINTKDEEGKNRTVLLEVNPNKDNVEIVHWYFVNNKNLELIKKQAIREGDQILILPSEQSEEVGGLSNLTDGLSAANVENSSEFPKNNQEKFSLRLQKAIRETDTEPTDAQKKSGNYKKGHVKFGGYDYTIENPKGSYRSGVDENGKKWKQKMHDTYGYIRGKFGKDGDHLDMFINDKADLDSWNGTVYIVDQVNKDGSFDEHKVMYGYDSLNAAKEAYLSNYEKGWTGLGNISAVEKADFDKWLDRSNRKLKPFADYTSITSKSDTYNVPNSFEEFLEHPVVRFSIRNESERAAAEDAYNYAQENRPDKYSQYAIVNMDRPGAMPEYMEKKKAADNWRRYYNKMEWGNYKLFDLNKPFEDNVKNLVGKFPNTFRKENDDVLSQINKLTADYNNRLTEYLSMSKNIKIKMDDMLKTNPSSVDVAKQILQTQDYKDMISKYQELMRTLKLLNKLKSGKVADGKKYSLKGVNNQSLFDAIHTLYSRGKTMASQLFNMKYFDVAETPDFMKRLGLSGDKFTVRYGVLSRHFGKDGSHDFTEAEWNNLPEALKNPFAIAKLSDKKNAYRIYTSLKTSKGEYVVVGADVKNAGRNLEVNSIATIFGRRNNASLPINEELLYTSKEITPEQMSLLSQPNSDQYPSNQELSAANVDNSLESAKNNQEKFSLKDSKADRIQKLRESKPVVITGNEYKGKYELNRESAKDWMKNNLRGIYSNKDTGEIIEIRKDGLQKVTSHSMGNTAHLQSLVAIPKLIENSIFIDELPNEKGNGKYDSYRYYVCGLKIGGEDYTVKVTVGVKGASKYYDHALTKIEKGNLLDNIDALSTTFDNKENTLISGGKDTKLISILQTNKENNDEKYSLRVDRYREELNQWKRDNNLPKDAERPQLPIREPNESAADFLKRVKEYRQQAALWATAPTYEQHLLTSDTAQGQFNLEMQRKAVLTRIVLQDSMLAIRKAQEAIMKEVGVGKLNFAEDAYTAENRSHGKAKNEFEEYNDEFLQPLRKAYNALMQRLGKSYDNVKVYMVAKHGLERNAHIAFKKALDEDYEKNEERMDAYNNYKADIDRLNNDADFEAGRIDFATWKQNDVNIRTKYAPSYSKYRFDEDGNTLDYSGLTALFDADDFESAAADLVKDVEDNNEYYTDELWYATNDATKKILRDSYNAGMMTEDIFNFVRGMYNNYIPLRGWGDTNADQVWNYVGGGKGAFSQVVKEAKGRKSLADDPIAYIENMAESGILMNNRNWVKQHLLLLAENHPTSLLNVSKAWYIKTTDAQGNEEWIPASPQITAGMNSKQVEAALEAFEKKMEQMAQKGDATQKREHLEISYPQTNGEEREHEVRVMKNGEEYVIYINGDPQLAQAMNNTRARKVREGLENSVSQRVIARTGRYMAAAYTSMSPLFIPSNYMRDLTMTLASTAIREDARYNYLLRRNMLRHWNTFPLVLRYQNGTLREKVRNGSASKVEQMFYDFMMNGGETGFVTSLDVEDLKKKFRNDLKDMNRMAANPKKVGHVIMDSIETLNRAIEDSNRFMVYMTSIEYGRSIDEAVNNAKDVTLNFNRKGTGEHGWQTIRNLYLFINPAIQSLQTLGALAKHHPVKFTAVTTTWLTSGVIVPLVNNLLMSFFGGDDDKDKYWQFTKWDRRNNFIMWVPFTHEFVKIPLAQEFRGFYGIGDMIASKLWGGEKAEESWGDYAMDLMGQIVDMLPLDPTGYDGNVAVSLMPNPIRPFFELAFNVDFTGKPLFKDSEYNKYDPNFTKVYVGTPEWLVRISRMVNSIGNDYPDVQQNWIDRAVNSRFNLNNPAVVDHVLSSYLGGAYTMGSQILGVMTKALNGDEIKMADIPLASKFVSNPDDRPVSKKQGDEFWNVKERHDRAANTLSKLKKKAKVDGDYSTLDMFFGSDEYKQYKEDDKVVKKYEEDRKKEKAQETGEEYKAHKTTGEDVYKSHATPKDDFEDMKMKQLYEKLNSFKIRYEAIDGISREKGDAYYKANKAAIEAIEEVAYDRKTISDIKKGFLYDGKDSYDANGMKDIRELRRRILDILEKANKAVLNRNK